MYPTEVIGAAADDANDRCLYVEATCRVCCIAPSRRDESGRTKCAWLVIGR
jgi:hypothetical protein